MELIRSHSWRHLPGVVLLLHGMLQRVHHVPDFRPVKDSILVRVEILELVAESISIEINSLHGFQDEQSELLKLIDGELLVAVFVSRLEHLSYHVLELLAGHVRSGHPFTGDHSHRSLGAEGGLEFNGFLALIGCEGLFFLSSWCLGLAFFLSVSSGFLGLVSGHDFLLGGFILVLLLNRSHDNLFGGFIFLSLAAALSEL